MTYHPIGHQPPMDLFSDEETNNINNTTTNNMSNTNPDTRPFSPTNTIPSLTSPTKRRNKQTTSPTSSIQASSPTNSLHIDIKSPHTPSNEAKLAQFQARSNNNSNNNRARFVKGVTEEQLRGQFGPPIPVPNLRYIKLVGLPKPSAPVDLPPSSPGSESPNRTNIFAVPDTFVNPAISQVHYDNFQKSEDKDGNGTITKDTNVTSSTTTTPEDPTKTVIDVLDVQNEDPFTLEPFESLIRLHAEKGKDFILARVTTVDPADENKFYYSFYAAHHINKVLFRTQPEEGLLHRMRAKNPLNNMTIVGDVFYYIIKAKDVNLQALKALEDPTAVDEPSSPTHGRNGLFSLASPPSSPTSRMQHLLNAFMNVQYQTETSTTNSTTAQQTAQRPRHKRNKSTSYLIRQRRQQNAMEKLGNSLKTFLGLEEDDNGSNNIANTGSRRLTLIVKPNANLYDEEEDEPSSPTHLRGKKGKSRLEPSEKDLLYEFQPKEATTNGGKVFPTVDTSFDKYDKRSDSDNEGKQGPSNSSFKTTRQQTFLESLQKKRLQELQSEKDIVIVTHSPRQSYNKHIESLIGGNNGNSSNGVLTPRSLSKRHVRSLSWSGNQLAQPAVQSPCTIILESQDSVFPATPGLSDKERELEEQRKWEPRSPLSDEEPLEFLNNDKLGSSSSSSSVWTFTYPPPQSLNASSSSSSSTSKLIKSTPQSVVSKEKDDFFYYTATYMGSDDDFLMKSTIRTYFRENALESQDAVLFTISTGNANAPNAQTNQHPTLADFLYIVQENDPRFGLFGSSPASKRLRLFLLGYSIGGALIIYFAIPRGYPTYIAIFVFMFVLCIVIAVFA